MSNVSQTDVLIVGAGPVGLSLAIMLAKMGINFKIIDKRTEATFYSRAFVIHSRTQEIFQQLGVLDTIASKGRVGAIGVQAYYQGKPAFDFKLPPSNSSRPYPVGLEQSEIELVLVARLNELGFQVEQGTELLSFKIRHEQSNIESAVVSHIKDGSEEVIEFKYVVGCDGGHSATRKLLDVPFSGDSVNIGLAVCDAVVETDLDSSHFASAFLGEKRNIGLIWLRENQARFVAPLLEGESEPNEEEFIKLVGENTSPLNVKIVTIKWLNTFRINERRAESHFKGNAFLCGDAAHVHSPAGGQGMNTGVQDAYNLAWKIALMVKGVGNEAVLSQNFDEERKRVAEMVLKNSGNLIRAVMTKPTIYTSLVQRYIFPFVMSFSFVQQQAVDSLSEVLISYDQNALVQKTIPGWVINGTIFGVGLRMPQFELVTTQEPFELSSTHQLFKGGHCFELIAYVPAKFLEKDFVETFRETLALLSTCPTLLVHRDGIKHSDSVHPLFSISVILDTKGFQVNQWCNNLGNTESATELKEYLKQFPTFLDQSSNMRNHYKLSQDSISLFVVRPDAYLGTIVCSFPNTIQKEIVAYFKGFLNDSN